MKNVFIAAIIAIVSTACVSNPNTRYDALERRNAQLAEENTRYRREYAQRQQATQDPGAPQGETKVVQTANVSTGAMWARQKHGPYMGAVGTQPRQMTQGRKIQVENLVCDDGARGFVCEDKDDMWGVDFNTWLSFDIDDQPALCDSGFYHPLLKASMLLPTQSCFVEIGAARKVKLTIRFYRNNGNPVTYADLDQMPYKTIVKIIKVPNGMFRLQVEENTSSAY